MSIDIDKLKQLVEECKTLTDSELNLLYNSIKLDHKKRYAAQQELKKLLIS